MNLKKFFYIIIIFNLIFIPTYTLADDYIENDDFVLNTEFIEVSSNVSRCSCHKC